MEPIIFYWNFIHDLKIKNFKYLNWGKHFYVTLIQIGRYDKSTIQKRIDNRAGNIVSENQTS